MDLGEAEKAKPEVMSVPLKDLSHLEDVRDATLETDSEGGLGFTPINTGSYLRSQSPFGKTGAKYARLATGANAISPPRLEECRMLLDRERIFRSSDQCPRERGEIGA